MMTVIDKFIARSLFTNKLNQLVARLAALSLIAVATSGWSANLLVNSGFENNPPNPDTIGNHIPYSITPWVLGSGAQANVVTVNGGTGYSNSGPALDAEGTPAGTFQHYLDISGGDNTVSQTFTVPTCGSQDSTPRTVDFSGYFSVRDSSSFVGSGYIRIYDETAGTELSRVLITNLQSTDANGNIVDPRIQTWKQFGGLTPVTPGHHITYTAFITNNLNFDRAYMAFSDYECPSTTLALAKQWNGAVNGHTATIVATRDNGATEVDRFVSTAIGTPSQLAQDSTPFIVHADDEIRIVETLAGGSATYTSTLSCTGDTAVIDQGVVQGNRQFSVKVGDVQINTAPIVCTVVNTNATQSTLTLVKQWFGAQVGDKAVLAASRSSGATLSLESQATSLANSNAGQNQSSPALIVDPGSTFTLAEQISGPGGSSPAVYDTVITCGGSQVNQITIPASTQAVCTMTNTLVAIQVDKQASVADTNGSTILGDAGDVITYAFTVTNTGRATLTNVTINDPMLAAANATIQWPAGTPQPVSLNEGQSITATATYTITVADMQAGKVENSATASGTSPKDTPVTSPPSSTTTNTQTPHPALGIAKAASISDTNRSGITGDAGDIITYTITVTNTGDTPLTGVSIADPLPGLSALSIAWPDPAHPGVLPLGRSAIATATYTVTMADAVARRVDNTSIANAPPVGGVNVPEVSDSARVPTRAPLSAIPTLSQWVLMLLSMVLAGLAMKRIRRAY